MAQALPEHDTAETASDNQPSPQAKASEPRELSRLDRLKLKIKKLGGKSPDIYPMF